MDLTELRAAIDEVDGELLTLLLRRAEISRMVGAAKKDEGGPVFRPEREQEVVERLLRINRESRGEGLPDEHIARIWREIFSSSRALQRPLRAAFLGPEGTFSHMAALECLGHSISAAPCENFDAVFRAVAEGTCDLGLVPLENSLHGSIGQCIDLFAEYDVHVVGEHYSRIRLCLMSRESGLSAVRRVYSHPQPFGQSRGWLRAHLPGAALMPEESTAAAALRVRDEAGSAAIGHPGLASMLGLDVLADSLEDSTSNWTRFAVIAPGREARSPGAEPGTALKTSLLFTVAHRPQKYVSRTECFLHQFPMTIFPKAFTGKSAVSLIANQHSVKILLKILSPASSVCQRIIRINSLIIPHSGISSNEKSRH